MDGAKRYSFARMYGRDLRDETNPMKLCVLFSSQRLYSFGKNTILCS
jgi:hypothetical protein